MAEENKSKTIKNMIYPQLIFPLLVLYFLHEMHVALYENYYVKFSSDNNNFDVFFMIPRDVFLHKKQRLYWKTEWDGYVVLDEQILLVHSKRQHLPAILWSWSKLWISFLSDLWLLSLLFSWLTTLPPVHCCCLHW